MSKIVAGTWIALLALLAGCATSTPLAAPFGAGGGQDVPTARAALLRAQTANQLAENQIAISRSEIAVARNAIAEDGPVDPPQPPPQPDPVDRIDLATFSWAGSKKADPADIPAGMKYGESVASGQRYCQWSSAELFIHAVFPATAKTASGATVAWYHFSRTATPHPQLAAFKWYQTHPVNSEGWYRWKRTK